MNITKRIAGIEVETAVCPPDPQQVKGSGQEVSNDIDGGEGCMTEC